MKESQIGSATPQYNPITLEIVPQDPQDADPALIHAVGRDTSAALGNDGYVIEPLYTNQRSGFLVEVTPLLNTVAADIWAQKDIILGDLSALVTILSAAVPIIKHLRKAYEKRVEKQSMRQEPIK